METEVKKEGMSVEEKTVKSEESKTVESEKAETVEQEETKSVESEKVEPVKLIENPMPLPKRHEKREMDYQYQVAEDKMNFDVEVSDGDDFDI